MFLVNYLNRNITDEFAPLFESLYILEFSVIIATLIISIPIADAVWQTSLHRNIKLRINFGIMEACISVIFRAIVIVHQYVGVTLVEYDEPPLYLVVCSLMREAFLCYFTTVASIIAFDRGVATIGWSWYESQVPSTLLFFACQESVLVGIAWLVSASLIYDYITDITIILYFAFILVIGSTAFIVVYRLNLKEVRILKQGAVVNQYSIARTYQLNENIAHLKMLSRLVGPLVAATTPAFVFYPVYRLIPPSIGYDGLRHFSVEMYDLWLGITGVLVITCVPVFEPKISRKLRLLPKSLGVRVIPTPSDEQSTKVNRLEGDTYFNMLSRDLTRVHTI